MRFVGLWAMFALGVVAMSALAAGIVHVAVALGPFLGIVWMVSIIAAIPAAIVVFEEERWR